MGLLLAACAVPALSYSERGILKLDNTTFDRIIDGSRSVFVRFDKEYSYGEEHDAWKEYAKAVGESAADLLSADVGVSGECASGREGLFGAGGLCVERIGWIG